MPASMRTPLLVLLLLCCSVTVCSAASYLYPGPPLLIQDLLTTTSTIDVPDSLLIADVTVTVDITHTFIGDLEISITSPAGTAVSLLADQGGSTNDVPNTTFADGGAPFNPGVAGTYAPLQPLSLLAGESSLGLWTLSIFDDAAGDVGTLNSWSLDITEAPIPEPATVLLVGLGLGGLILVRRRSQRTS